jgi:hypothetical protein
MSEQQGDALRPDERLCPYCAEVIKRAAVKCRWCGSEIRPEPAAAEQPEQSEAEATAALEAGVGTDDGRTSTSDEDVAVMEPARRPRTGSVVTAVLVVLLIVACAGLALAIKRANDDSVAPDGELSSAAVRAGIMSQAISMTETAMSYRAAQADDDIAAAEKLMTPAMRTKYEADLPPADKRPEQARMKVTIKASVASLSGKKSCSSDDCAVSIVTATPDRARVLVFVNQAATAASSTNSVASPQWELLTLVKRGGDWLIDDMASE